MNPPAKIVFPTLILRAEIGGERTKLQAAHFKLCYNRAFVLRAYRLQTQEMLFDASESRRRRNGKLTPREYRHRG